VIDTAVILAAGLGSRLGKLTEDAPKGFLDFEGESLIARSIKIMEEAGISRIFIGVGYLAGSFRTLEKLFPGISFKFFENEKYSETGSMYTLFRGKDLIDDDFFLFESDLLYEPYAISCLISDPRNDIVLASGFTGSGDEVWIEKDENDVLTGMSKNKDDLSHIDGELVGITKLSLKSARLLFDFIGPYLDSNPKMDYEQALVLLSGRSPVYVKVVEDLAWCEIDDTVHLERAGRVVFPRITENRKLR